MALYQAGFNAKVRINGLVYVAATYRARDLANDAEVSNTEGIPGNPAADGGVLNIIVPQAESRITALQHMEAEVRNATFDLLRNPFAVPPGPNVSLTGAGIKPGNYIYLQIFPAGITSVSWLSPSFMILESSQDGDVKMLQPVSFSGKSDGFYHAPWV